MKYYDKLIFELSESGRCAFSLREAKVEVELPDILKRQSSLPLPEVSEVDVVRHYTNLSQMNFGVDTGFYPLGSCTMKYNPKIDEEISQLPEFRDAHPLMHSEGLEEIYSQLDKALAAITGMSHFTFQPCAGAHRSPESHRRRCGARSLRWRRPAPGRPPWSRPAAWCRRRPPGGPCASSDGR